VLEHVFRIGRQVGLDYDAERHVEQFKRIFLPDEFAGWLLEFRRGQWVFVRIRAFADIVDGDGVTRLYDGEVDAVQFARPHLEDNLQGAREALTFTLDALIATLRGNGVQISSDCLAGVPHAIELDAALQDALR